MCMYVCTTEVYKISLTITILTVALVSGCVLPHLLYTYGHYRVLRKDFHDSEMRIGHLNQELK